MTTKEICSTSFDELLEQRGIKRRDFLKLCAGIAATLGLSQTMIPRIAHALEESVIGATSGNLKPALWLELSSCSGCTESFAQSDSPNIATVILELLSLNYSEALCAGAGWSLELAKEQTIDAGGYLLIIEGSLMEGWDGNALVIAEEKGTEIVEHAASHADAIICVGSCSVDGGWQSAYPNPSGAIGIPLYLNNAKAAGRLDYDLPPIVNLPHCPANPEHVAAVVVEYLLLKRFPELTNENKPAMMFSQTIHDNCPRRGHFENGEFVYEFGTEAEVKRFCLYPVGCKGPETKSNCPVVRWNRRNGWCIDSGAPCIGCATTNPRRPGFNWVDMNAPFRSHLRNVAIGDFNIPPAFIAYGVAGALVLGLVIHGFGMKASGRLKGGAPYERERKWDTNHPERAIGPAKAAEKAAEKAAAAKDKDDAKSKDKNKSKKGDSSKKGGGK
ncbi:MAG: hydrogenase small subunit [Coriobacteriia bacterium]|nr:hydrogenase small subunit [Coriobacteriia bacterium]